MASIPLTRRSLAHYWRTHLAVVAGVGVAVAVLTGSLLVGDSVRGSLKRLALQRLGAAHWVLTSTVYFREALAGEMAAHPGFSRSFGAVCPILVQEGWLTQPRTGRRAGGVSVYGVDERFWRFQGVELDRAFGSDVRSGRQVLLSPEAARDLMAEEGSSVLLRLEEPSNVPRDSLHGRRDRVGRTLRLSVSGILQPSRMGEFSLSPRQGPVRAAFVPLRRLQRDLGVPNRINTLLVSRAGASRQQTSDPAQTGELAGILRDVYSLEDTDLKLRVLERQQCLSVETEGTLIGEGLAARVQDAADTLGLRTSLLFTYLANSIRSGGREIPYSLVTALDFPSFGLPPASPGGEMPPLVLNRWAARDLEARPGDLLELDYYLWAEQGRLLTRSAKFRLSSVVPMEGPLADRDLAPAYPGITESRTLVDWDPPFPMELGRIRPGDESYWEEYRTTPKAFVPLQVGQELWRSRHGQLSSIRVYPAAAALAVAPETLRDLRSRLESELKRTTDPRPLRLLAAGGRRSSRAGLPGGHRLRAVFRLLQLLPGGLGSPAHQPFFQAGSGAAGPGDWIASSPGLRSCRNPPPVPQGGSPAGGAGHAGGSGGGRGLHRPHHAGTAHLVGGGRGHHPAGASPLGLFPARRRSGGNPDRPDLHHLEPEADGVLQPA